MACPFSFGFFERRKFAVVASVQHSILIHGCPGCKDVFRREKLRSNPHCVPWWKTYFRAKFLGTVIFLVERTWSYDKRPNFRKIRRIRFAATGNRSAGNGDFCADERPETRGFQEHHEPDDGLVHAQ